MRTARLRFTGGLWGYVAGVLAAAFWSAAAGLVIYALLAVYYVFVNRRSRVWPHRRR